MNTEGQNYSAGDFIDYTPGSVKVAGEIVQIGTRAAMCATAIAASALGAAQVRGIVKARAAAVTGIVGELIGWDDDGDPYGGTAGTGAATTILADADYLLGRLAKALTATDGEAQVDLNVVDDVQTTSVTLTSAQILLLATTQIELVAAPGADRFIDVHSITMILDYGSNVFTEPSAPDDLEVVYDAAGGTSIADVIGDFIINSADFIARPQIKDNAGLAVTTIVNKAVVLDNNGANYGGNAGDDSLLIVITNYSVRRAGLA
jgi:hypothetical protein